MLPVNLLLMLAVFLIFHVLWNRSGKTGEEEMVACLFPVDAEIAAGFLICHYIRLSHV